ncbi:MAG: carboxypeptidase regulatory-like domain-containing protein [Bacteroidales bacterium]|nr:carboxypeptidase regulatory-like domain-containing protein [Bacteroidales bacterium]
MKKLLYITCSIALCLLMVLGYGCKPEEKNPLGSIYGMVFVATTGEPMRGTGVELYFLNEQGTAGALLLRTATTDNGSYSFEDVKTGEYLLRVEVPGYRRTEYKVVVEGGRLARVDMQIQPKGEGDVYIIKAENLMVQKEDIGEEDWVTADALCRTSTVGGYTDWRLPTKYELMVLYSSRKLIGGFQNAWYWSGTESGSSDYPYSCIDFTNGTVGDGGGSCRVRAVRSIE